MRSDGINQRKEKSELSIQAFFLGGVLLKGDYQERFEKTSCICLKIDSTEHVGRIQYSLC